MSGDLWWFAGVMVLGQFSPGPDMVLLTRTALRHGVGAGVGTALGIVCGLAFHATVAVAGMAVVFEKFPMMRGLLRWAAAFYLLWLAFGLLRDARAAWRGGASVGDQETNPKNSPFVRGLLCNLLNPKAALFLAAVCAPFLSGIRPPWWPLAIWGIVVGLGACLWPLWVVILQWPPLRRIYERAACWLDGAFGLALLALAVGLVTG